jgi:SAM-dependent methyltransferase
VVAIDTSPEVIAINRDRVQSPQVEYQVADAFSWQPPQTFDAVFFSFWLSHVPPTRFEAFWTAVRRALRPDGQAFFIDSLPEQTSAARDAAALDDSGVIRRRLNDQREFHIVKVFYEPASLEQRLQKLGWHGWVRATEKFFLYGAMSPLEPARRGGAL